MYHKDTKKDIFRKKKVKMGCLRPDCLYKSLWMDKTVKSIIDNFTFKSK